jgi:hypothetical protein
MVLHFAISIFAALIRGDAETTNGSTLGGIAQLGIATEISHDNYSIKGHEEPFFLLGLTDRRDTTSENLKNQANPIFNAINLLCAICVYPVQSVVKQRKIA